MLLVVIIVAAIVAVIMFVAAGRPLPVSTGAYCQTSCIGRNAFLMLPIERDAHGLPLIELWIGAQPVKAVLDSASCMLLVAGDECTSCDAKLGKYRRRDVETETETKAEGGVATFGTQTDDWTECSDVVAVSGRCVRGLGDVASRRAVDDVTMYLGTCSFGVTAARRASAYAMDMPQSNYNVCGVGRCRGGLSFLGQLTDDRTFTFIHTPSRDSYVMLREAALGASAVRVPLCGDDDVYAVALHRATLGGVPLAGLPPRVLFDTGSNYLFAPDAVCSALEAQRGAVLRLEFVGENAATGEAAEVALALPASSYAPAGHTYCAPTYPTDDFLIVGTLLLTEPVAIAFSPDALLMESLV